MPHLVSHAVAPNTDAEGNDSEFSQTKPELPKNCDDRNEGSELLLSLALTASQVLPLDVGKRTLTAVEGDINALKSSSSSMAIVTPLRRMRPDAPLPFTKISQAVQSDAESSSSYFEHSRVGHNCESEPTIKNDLCHTLKGMSELESVNLQATNSAETAIVTPHSRNRKKISIDAKLNSGAPQHHLLPFRHQVAPRYQETCSQLPWNLPYNSSNSRFAAYSPQISKSGSPTKTSPSSLFQKFRALTYPSPETGTPGLFQISRDRRSPSDGSSCLRRSNERSPSSRCDSFVMSDLACLHYETGIACRQSPPGPLRHHADPSPSCSHATGVPKEALRYGGSAMIHQYHPSSTAAEYPPAYPSTRDMPFFGLNQQEIVETKKYQSSIGDQKPCRERSEAFQEEPAERANDAKKEKSQDLKTEICNERLISNKGDRVVDIEEFEKKKMVNSLSAYGLAASNRFHQLPVVQSQIRSQRLQISHQPAVPSTYENKTVPREMHERLRAHQFRGMAPIRHPILYAHRPGVPCSPPFMHRPGNSAMWRQGALHVQQDYQPMNPPVESFHPLHRAEWLHPPMRAGGDCGPGQYSGNPTHAVGVDGGTSYHQTPPTQRLVLKPDQSKPNENERQVIQESAIKSVAQWQAALAANKGVPPSTNRCVPLKPPIPSRFWGDMKKMSDAFIPDFHIIVNFPDYLQKSRPPPGAAGNDHDVPNGMKRCVMCGEERLCLISASNTTGGGRSKTHTQKTDLTMSIAQEGLPCSSENSIVHIIPRQNKGLCTSCDVTVWVITQSNIEIKWCKGCKNFRPWASFGEKGHATKCVRCRDRQREKYLLQKDDQLKKKRKSSNKHGGDEELVVNARKDIYKVSGVSASEERDEECETGYE